MKRKRLYRIFIVLIAVLVVTCITLSIFLIITNSRLKSEKKKAAKTAALSEENIEEAKETARQDLLKGMKDYMSAGNGTYSMFMKYFPDYVVYYNHDGKLVFADVDKTLAQNTKKRENYKTDSDGYITYSEDNIVVSHKGLDASRFQGTINFSKLKDQGFEYVLLRCGFRSYGDGVLNQDASFDDYCKDALKSGLKVGTYFFSSAVTTEEAVEEANYVLDIIRPYKITYPVVIDFEEIDGESYRQEDLSKQEATDIVKAFCETIKNAGYTPMIYSNLRGFIDRLDMSQLEDYEKWFAYYSDAPYFPYDFSIWQYTSTMSVDGVSSTSVDIDISFKTY